MLVKDLFRDEMAALSDVQLVSLLSETLSVRPGLSSVRDEVVGLLACANTIASIRDSYLTSWMSKQVSVSQLVWEAQIEGEARLNILEQPQLTSEEVATILGATGRSKSSRLRTKGAVVGLDVNGRTLFPAFQFDPTSHRVRPIVDKINQILGAKDDPWGVASWWLSESGTLADEQSPAMVAEAGGQDELLERMARSVTQG